MDFRKSAAVAMSGGVDSSVAALLLQREGFDLRGVTLRLQDENLCLGALCGAEDTVRDAALVAEKLGIPFEAVAYGAQFKEQVMDYFAHSYFMGETPNPCVQCNRTIKFPRMFQYARESGCSHVATGHYARIDFDPGSGRWLLKKGKSGEKDQSYVLYSLSQDQLSRLLFPVGELEKEQVRDLAREVGLAVANKKDSQDICFIPDGDYRRFLAEVYNMPMEAGDFVSEEGYVYGQHKGAVGYTVGQRKGLGIAWEHPLYVLRKDMENNRVILGRHEALFSQDLTARNVNWIAMEKLRGDMTLDAKIRYSQRTAKARVSPLDDGRIHVEFPEPQRAISPGQSVVFYDGDTVVGGGVIEA